MRHWAFKELMRNALGQEDEELDVGAVRGESKEEKVKVIGERTAMNVDNWNVDDVCEFLDKLELGHLNQAFRENGVSGKDLKMLTDEELMGDLGLKSLQVKKIRRELSTAESASPKPSGPVLPDVPAVEQVPPQGYPQRQPQPYSQGYPQGPPQGYPQGPPQGYPRPPQGYPQGAPQGYPNAYGQPPAEIGSRAPAPYQTRTADTGPNFTRDGLIQYKELSLVIKKLESQRVETDYQTHDTALTQTRGKRDQLKKDLADAKQKKVTLEKSINHYEQKKRLMAKMTKGKKETAEHDLETTTRRISQLEEQYSKAATAYNSEAIVVENLEGKVRQLKKARSEQLGLVDSLFTGSDVGGDKIAKDIHYEIMDLKPRISEIKVLEARYQEAENLMKTAYANLGGAQKHMEQAFSASGMDVAGNFFTPGPGVQGPFDLGADIIKRQAVKQSSALVKTAGDQIEKARVICPDMPPVNLDVIKKMPGLIMDLMLDNMITDIRSRRKIKESLQNISLAVQETGRATQWLTNMVNSECKEPRVRMEGELSSNEKKLDNRKRALWDQALVSHGL